MDNRVQHGSWIRLALMELDQIEPKDFHEHSQKVVDEKSDHVLGEVSVDGKRVSTMIYALEREIDTLKLEAKYTDEEASKTALIIKASECSVKQQVWTGIFWLLCAEQFGAWDKECLGIRKGWQAVWSDPPRPSILKLFGADPNG